MQARTMVIAGLVGAASLVPAGAALAKDGDVEVERACSGPSTIELKLSPENGRLEVEVEVDRNRRGVAYNWSIWRGKARLAFGTRTTAGVSGSFEVRRVVNDRAGTDTLTAKATRKGGGETCTVTARI